MSRQRAVARFAWFAAPLATWASSAAACPVCFAAKGEANRQAFVGTTLFMSALPLLMVGALVWWAARRLKQHELEQTAAKTVEGPGSSRGPNFLKEDAPAVD